MKHRSVSIVASLTLALAIVLCASVDASGQNLSVWQADVCDKIFPDTPAGEENTIKLQAASNEYESALVGLLADSTIEELNATVSDLSRVEQNAIIPSANIRVRAVGTLRLEHNTPQAENIVTRKAPCEMPEILYERSTVSLKKDESTSIWLTLYIPKGTPPGIYAGTLTLTAKDFSKEIPLEVEVFPFELSDARRLYATNWWSPNNVAIQHNVEFMSEEYWAILEKYIQNMGEHRQNVLCLFWVPGNFVVASINEDGSWEVNLDNFDRLVNLALQYGVLDRLELFHIGGVDRQEHCVRLSAISVYDARKKERIVVEIDEWLEPVLKTLCDYLRERNLFERAMIHVADEPYQPDVAAWREASKLIRAIEPDLKQIEAIEAINFDDCLDVWVPKLSHFDRWRNAFEARRDKGEFWYYICCHPFGETYPNRFMDLPGVRARVLHWLNYSEDLVGYLHWGYNYWQGDPFGPPTQSYGPGDTHVVYPGDNGPLDSIRWEIERESLEDYEYLKLLEDKIAELKSNYDPEKAWFVDPKSRPMELARRVAPSIAATTLDYNVVNQARLEIVNEIKNLDGPVTLFVQTYPQDGATVYVGPTLFEIYGITTPGAEVTINGKRVNVDSEGFFEQNPSFSAGTQELDIVAKLNGQTAKTTRRFIIE